MVKGFHIIDEDEGKKSDEIQGYIIHSLGIRMDNIFIHSNIQGNGLG